MKNITFKRFASITLFSLIITSLVLAVFGLFAYRAKEAETELVKQRLHNAATTIEYRFFEIVDYTSSVLGYMGRQIRQNNDTRDYEHILGLFRAFGADAKVRASHSWTVVGWVDKDFQTRVDHSMGILAPDKAIDLSFRDYLPPTKEEPWEIKLGKPAIGSTSGKWIIPAGVGATNFNNEYIGSLVFGFEVEKLKAQFEDVLDGTGINFSFIGKDLSAITHSYQAPIINRKAFERINFDSEKSNESMVVDVLTGENYFAYKMPKYPYVLYLSYDRGGVVDSFWGSLKRNLPEAMLAITICFLIAWLFQKHISSPVRGMANALSSVQKGYRYKMLRPQLGELRLLARNILKLELLKKRLVRRLEKEEKERSIAQLSASAKEHFLNELDQNLASNLLVPLSMSIEEVNVKDVVERHVEINARLAYQRKIKLNTKMGSVKITTDSIKFNRVIGSLIHRAVKYSLPNSTIEVMVFIEHTSVVIVIRDSVSGMHPDVFGSMSNKRGFTDLNQNEMEQIVEGLGGVLQEDRSFGEGGKVRLYMPLKFSGESEKAEHLVN